jgi:tRNA-specific 2-thiouridylase
MNRPRDTTVVVGISGGVDSAVAALLLREQGYTVHGLHMTNWDEDDDYCSAAEDYQVARQVCADLGIPLHRADFSREYRAKVFRGFLDEIRHGFTPNPDVACNRYIKFGDFLDYARRLGADKIATGHYARVAPTDKGHALLRGMDRRKDQSYFLHAIDPAVLSRVLFPLGELRKTAVRRLANEHSLPNHARRDSTGICFIGERPFRAFLQNYVSGQAGAIETPDGTVVGAHDGLMFYTLGQRQGLAIGGQRNFGGEPWYVAAKDHGRNVLIVVQGRDDPALWYPAMTTGPLHRLAPDLPTASFDCTVRTRYRQDDVPCTVSLGPDGRCRVEFAEPVWAVTPGQYAVFYRGELCLGGARIEAAQPLSANGRPNNDLRRQARSISSM